MTALGKINANAELTKEQAREKRDKELRQACAAFEGMFMDMMMKSKLFLLLELGVAHFKLLHMIMPIFRKLFLVFIIILLVMRFLEWIYL